jgi:hypothetical protein
MLPSLQMISDDNSWMYLFIDTIYVATLPSMGFAMDWKNLNYAKNDVFTKQLAWLRVMPISPKAIVIARYLQLFVTLIVPAVVFFGVQYLLSANLRNLIGPADYLAFVLIWLGYSLSLAAIYICCELGLPGKIYFKVCFGFIPFYIGLAWLPFWIGSSYVKSSLLWAQDWGLFAPLIMFTISFILLFVCGIVTSNRIKSRDLD